MARAAASEGSGLCSEVGLVMLLLLLLLLWVVWVALLGSAVAGCCCWCCWLRVWGMREAERSSSLVVDVDEVVVLRVGRGCWADIVLDGRGSGGEGFGGGVFQWVCTDLKSQEDLKLVGGCGDGVP